MVHVVSAWAMQNRIVLKETCLTVWFNCWNKLVSSPSQRLNTTPYSLDLNPLEHQWFGLKNRMAQIEYAFA